MQQWLSRTELLLGKPAIEKLRDSKVLVVGLGGVGGYTLEALTRTGIHNYTLIDSDTFEETNLNRQVLCTQESIGKYKTLIAKDRITSIDKTSNINTYELFLDSSNIETVFKEKYDLVVDAIDSVESKCLLIDYCLKHNIPVVSSMGAGFRKDPTKVRIADISQTFGDPLAKTVRQKLKRFGINSGFSCVFSSEKPMEHDYKTIASLASVTGTMGLCLAQLAIDSLIKNYQ